MIDPALKQRILWIQRNEITEHLVYRRLATTADSGNKEVLERIAADEERHYREWARYTGECPPPYRMRVFLYTLIARVLGLTFALKLMEKGEQLSQATYEEIARQLPSARELIEDENRHELMLLDLLDEERLRYVGSVVLGLSDALVELAGALAGLTFALRSTRLVALAALVTGLAASLSMAASEYLSKKSEAGNDGQEPLKAAAYTGLAYVLTVILLITPYFLVANAFIALAMSLAIGILEVLMFSGFLAVTQDKPLGRTFLEMALITLGVAVVSFGIGVAARSVIGVDV